MKDFVIQKFQSSSIAKNLPKSNKTYVKPFECSTMNSHSYDIIL